MQTEIDRAYKVSTHAPAWGATKYQITGHYIRLVSTHAPAWGATLYYWSQT